MAAFELSKWYLDCVTEGGDASILYTGKVRWGPVALHYSSRLESTGKQVASEHSLRSQEEPVPGDGVLLWRSNEWRQAAMEINETVFESEHGKVEWRCLMPRARARLGERNGLGYVEHLRMSVAPWQLPIQTLRWGRFASDSDWVVWIDWIGDFQRRIVYRNGAAAETDFLGDERIEFADGFRLVMEGTLVLRDGALGTTALAGIPGLRDTYPARLLNIKETKWRSRARLECNGVAVSEGWAIHERVEWPQ